MVIVTHLELLHLKVPACGCRTKSQVNSHVLADLLCKLGAISDSASDFVEVVPLHNKGVVAGGNDLDDFADMAFQRRELLVSWK